MIVVNFIIAILALVLAVIALQRTGGMKNLRENVAEVLVKLEQKVRSEGNAND
jgi:anaerobic C4-dicarboxylate transporter